MITVATQVPINTIVPMLIAISDRNWEQFKTLESDFVDQYGVDVWEEVFNFRLKPALDKDSDRWLLVQWCSTGIKSVKNVT
ncbi:MULTISPECIES: hypothetical protein [unclassified Anabaena]|uniref:hypothetical protein n=1 Tax=unclassified Anabaena TaxID=2619674 RepID=UPI00144733A3|nr:MULTISPECIES: hypothetical protein [unclassified Anabaena]MTJ07738.1 hypothetical protein [Anabaena sp. UHCC 0204]MTJ51756.1 hypothetical protein [Anabaena sp. UHCC 0253]